MQIWQKFNTDEPAAETLYRDASDRKERLSALQKEKEEYLAKQINSSKIIVKSHQMVTQRIEKLIKAIVKEAEEHDSEGTIKFEGLGMILYQLGIFQNLKFAKQDKTGHSSLGINHMEAKPDRISFEMQFHEKFWTMLNTPFKREKEILSDLVFDFLMVLLETKTPVARSAEFLLELMNKTIEYEAEGGQIEKKSYDEIREANGLWSMEKLVLEFRRLFIDKTSFMNIYTHPTELTKTTPRESYYNHPHRPTINVYSAKLDVKQIFPTHTNNYSLKQQYKNENYMTKTIKSRDEDGESKEVKNRIEILYEHHKYLQKKQEAEKFARSNEELKECTFKPQTTRSSRKTQENVAQKGPSVHTEYLRLNKSPEESSDRYNLLHQHAVNKQRVFQEKIEINNQIKVEKEVEGCTFQPNIYTSDKDVEKVREESFYEGIPNGFKRSVERMLRGREKREEQQRALEKISLGENYDANRKAEFKPPSMLTRQKPEKEKVLVYLDVNVAPGKTGRIGIHKGDNAKVLARNFGRTYSLGAATRNSLEELVQAYINQFFPEDGEEAKRDERIDYSGPQHYQAQAGIEEENDEEEQAEEEEEERTQERGQQRFPSNYQRQQQQQQQEEEDLEHSGDEEEQEEQHQEHHQEEHEVEGEEEGHEREEEGGEEVEEEVEEVEEVEYVEEEVEESGEGEEEGEDN